MPSNLGNGLDKLVASNLAVASAKTEAPWRCAAPSPSTGKTYVDETTAAVATSAL